MDGPAAVAESRAIAERPFVPRAAGALIAPGRGTKDWSGRSVSLAAGNVYPRAHTRPGCILLTQWATLRS